MCLLPACRKHSEVENPPPVVDAASIEESLRNAESGYRGRADLSKLRDAIQTLSRVRDPEHRNFDVERSFAKYNYFLGIHSTDEKERDDAFEKGRDAGKIAKNMEPGKPDGYFWYGANLGEMSRESPVTVGLQSVDDIREAMNKVLEMQPDFQGASAFDALAQVELATRINGGKAETAVTYLEKGVALAPDNSNLHLHLAEAYLAVNRDKDARQQLEYLIKMTPNADFIPEHRDAVEAAKKLLQTKF
ncbi:MAG TPA: tetratricopeptide repeat protein [Pyrinomonadaceae bacterium]|nr:tetratricopeptide repeat protein [Pyrinomonadaceae bacterium]